MRGVSKLLLSAVLVLVTAWVTAASGTDCPERASCRGCGCKGGTGYRGPNGRCVGFKQIDAVCGSPPGTRCVFENAPGTGENRDCALAPRRKPASIEPVPEKPSPDPVSGS